MIISKYSIIVTSKITVKYSLKKYCINVSFFDKPCISNIYHKYKYISHSPLLSVLILALWDISVPSYNISSNFMAWMVLFNACICRMGNKNVSQKDLTKWHLVFYLSMKHSLSSILIIQFSFFPLHTSLLQHCTNYWLIPRYILNKKNVK